MATVWTAKTSLDILPVIYMADHILSLIHQALYLHCKRWCHQMCLCWFKCRVTRIIVNDSESQKLYVVNFINRQTLYHSIDMISKIMWEKYCTDSWSATIIVLSNVATPKNCTIMRRMRNSVLQESLQTLVRNSVSLVSDDCLQLSKKLIFSVSAEDFEYRQCLRLLAGINSCSDNASKVFNRRQICQIWRPIFLWNVMSNVVFQLGDWGLWGVCMSTILLILFIRIARKQLCRSTSVLIAARLNAWLHFLFKYFVEVVDLTTINGSFPRNDVKFC